MQIYGKFSQLIIEAYRNPNFRFAEEPSPEPEPEIVAPTALNYPGLFARMQSLEDDKKLSIYMNLKRAQTKLKLKYNIDSLLPIKLDSTKSPAEYSDNSNSNTDEKIQTYFYRVFAYLVDYFENEASSAPTSESTSSSESEESNPFAVTDPSTDSSSSETSATTETTSSGETTSTTSSDTSEELAENIPPITIKVSGKEYSPAKSITLVKRVNLIGSNRNSAIVLDDDSVTDYNCFIQFENEKWKLSKFNDSYLTINGNIVDEFFELNVGDYFVPGTKETYILSVERIGTDSGGFSGESAPSSGGFFGDGGGSGGGFGGRRRSL